MTVIYHNPACGTSRNVLAILRAAGEVPEVVEYLKTGWDEARLTRLFTAAGLTPREALRLKGTPAEELGLTAPGIGDAAIIAAMIAHPILVQRPFVVTGKGTKLCRPSVTVAQILPRLPEAPVLAADGKVIFDPADKEVRG
ncbi:arsenate reductase (glutaredoxin) [Pseudogemmobacter bohemicus]|uniref:arsenate reductase (glutaredoxin) n=1 Tax=Pseudogemmobacter bohemicus TaxID=2250708 RepID=UPI000DD4B775|nr:arsenate reductase (glutaredoxin) [Pseudogemmobacter bohemicus]